MGKRKSRNVKWQESGVEVLTEDLSEHPLCPHGPTLLFSGARGDFFACASCRGGECPVRIARDNWSERRVRDNNRKYAGIAPRHDREQARRALERARDADASVYCASCDQLIPGATSAHSSHRVIHLTQEQLHTPSSWLPPLNSDTHEAQYFFSSESVRVLLGFLHNNGVRRVVCVGTPSLHEVVNQQDDMVSLLLDIDTRHRHFWINDFLWYNMFNHHFFNGDQDERILKNFLSDSSENKVCIVLDPPFGGRLEALAHTLRRMSAACTVSPHIVLVFPYFNEPHITNLMPELRMHDYQVRYTNHPRLDTVRLFTSLPLGSLDLSGMAGYRRCEPCARWVRLANRHCDKCGACTSKSGATYEHCDACARCVKATYFHCDGCGRCCLRDGHRCRTLVCNTSCYSCKQKGHKQSECPNSNPEKSGKSDNKNRGMHKRNKV